MLVLELLSRKYVSPTYRAWLSPCVPIMTVSPAEMVTGILAVVVELVKRDVPSSDPVQWLSVHNELHGTTSR